MPARREEELRLLRAYHSTGDPRAREAAVERFLRSPEPRPPLQRRQRAPRGPRAGRLPRARPGGRRLRPHARDGVHLVCGPEHRRRSSATSATTAGRCGCRGSPRSWRAVERLNDELIAEHGHAPTATEIAESTGGGIEVEDVREAREAFRALHSASLDQPRGRRDDDAGSLLETLGDADLELGRAHDRGGAALRARHARRARPDDHQPLLPGRADPGRDRGTASATRRCTCRGCSARPSSACGSQPRSRTTRSPSWSASDGARPSCRSASRSAA